MGKRERGGALDGDTVKVQITKAGAEGKKAEAEVIGLVKRTEKVLVKYIKKPKSSFGFVQIIEGFAGKRYLYFRPRCTWCERMMIW